jgi:hypothetical protein
MSYKTRRGNSSEWTDFLLLGCRQRRRGLTVSISGFRLSGKSEEMAPRVAV